MSPVSQRYALQPSTWLRSGPLRDVRNHFSDVIDRVEHEHERVTVTRNGRHR